MDENINGGLMVALHHAQPVLSRVVRENIEALAQREVNGTAEHGDNMDRTDYSASQWAAEWNSEHLDAANYSRKLMHMLPRLEAAAALLERIGFAWDGVDWRPPAAQEAICRLDSGSPVPRIEWLKHWGDLPEGMLLYAAPVLAAPAQPGALAASIAELEAFLGGECVEPLTLAQSEAAMLVLQELKRRMASALAAPGIGLTPHPMATAPRDGTMLRLLVQFDDHATDDTDGPAWTIGHCSKSHPDDDDHWQFAGWCWDHDHFTEGKGTPVGWLPLIDASPKGDVHPDDLAVDAFSAAMKAKLAEARAKGRGGWDGDEQGMQQLLSNMLRDHVEKGDPRDVANFCMFLHQRGEGISPKGGSNVVRGVTTERLEDMSVRGRLKLYAEEDGDMCLMVVENDGTSAGIEFCASGGRSPRTLEAVRALSRAMEQDNAEHPISRAISAEVGA